ncbi:6-hydroxy-D-nicotine oxidase [Balamuthia mandrillaris]
MKWTALWVVLAFALAVGGTEINFNFAGLIPAQECPPAEPCETNPLVEFTESLSAGAKVHTPPTPTFQQILSSYFTSALDGSSFPALIVQPAEVSDVVKAVNFARERGLNFGVKSGGHGHNGMGIPPFGLLLDLSLMRAVEVDEEENTIRFQGGAICGDLDAATQPYNRAAVCGNCYSIGAGFIAHGGYGALSRLHGLAIDNLVSVDLVTAAGQVVTASESENEDLFWAVRGALPNFGVAVSFVVRTHDVSTYYGGVARFGISSAMPIVEWLTSQSNNPNLHARVSATPPAQTFAMEVALWGDGTVEEKAAFFTPLLEIEGLLSSTVGTPTYFQQQLASKPNLDAAPRRQKGFTIAGNNQRDSAEFYSTYIEHYLTIPFSTGASAMNFWGGAIAEVPRNATAFWGRGLEVDWFMTALFVNPVTDVATLKAGLGEAAAALSNVEGALPDVNGNWLSTTQEGIVERMYGDNLERLRELKAVWDPNNFFKANYNILPAE